MKSVLFLLTVLVLVGCERNNTDALARDYYMQMYSGTAKAVMCTERDTDGDGYVTCDVASTDEKIGVISLQCPVMDIHGTSCKSSLAKSNDGYR